jgi:hypothetical protein
VVASSPTSDQSSDLGSVTTSHIGGGAVWWKSPSTALARGRDGQPPDLLYKYEWIDFSAYNSWNDLVNYVEGVIKGFGGKYKIIFG